ncbi:DUF6415 family natural product biosynthesis protein [Streptomyces griseofuscus]|uniref:DUF6415 family natural product biosynthesis protein n=1 Tax=Streptomyces griseofuscus TaxID=146922 RepID=UPI0033C76C19
MTIQVDRTSVMPRRSQAGTPERKAEPWQPPLSAGGLADVLGLMRRWAWTEQHTEALLEDVALALDDVLAPSEEVIEDIVQRFRGHLMKLVDIAVSSLVWQGSAYANTLILRGRALRAEEMPGDYPRAVQHLRQMGWIVSELLDQLVACESIEGVA